MLQFLIYQSQTILTSLLSQFLWLVIFAKTREVKSLIFVGNIQSVSRWSWLGLFFFLRSFPGPERVLGLNRAGGLLVLRGVELGTEMECLISSLSCFLFLPNKSQYCCLENISSFGGKTHFSYTFSQGGVDIPFFQGCGYSKPHFTFVRKNGIWYIIYFHC